MNSYVASLPNVAVLIYKGSEFGSLLRAASSVSGAQCVSLFSCIGSWRGSTRLGVRSLT